MNVFIVLVKNVTENIAVAESDAGRKLSGDRQLAWEMYRELKSVFNAVNHVFGMQQLLFHVGNVLRYAIFMERCIYLADSAAIVYIQMLYDIIRSEIIYIIAARIAKQVIENICKQYIHTRVLFNHETFLQLF